MVISSFLLLDVRKTIRNHPYFDGLYHPFVVKLGMDPIALPTSFFVEEITAKCSSHFTVPGLPMDLRRSPWLESHRDRDVRRWLSNIKYIYNMYICIIHNIYMYHYVSLLYIYTIVYIYIHTFSYSSILSKEKTVYDNCDIEDLFEHISFEGTQTESPRVLIAGGMTVALDTANPSRILPRNRCLKAT